MLGAVMCATLHNNTLVRRTVSRRHKSDSLIVKKDIVQAAVSIGEKAGKIIHVREIRSQR